MIVLGGYMRLLLDPLLSAYQDRIINVHPSELPVNIPLLNQNPVKGSERKYVGDNAVLDALVGDDVTETRSSVIMVDGGVDHGEILVQGPEVELWKEFYWGVAAERAECLKKYADAHQSFQKVRSDWPALTTALGYIANGRIALGTEKVHHNEWRQVFVDDKPMPYEGLKLNK